MDNSWIAVLALACLIPAAYMFDQFYKLVDRVKALEEDK